MLAGLLRTIQDDYDYILIDCLPSLGLLAINALRAASGIIIPVQADFLAMQGLAQILETIAAVREQLNPDLSIAGVLLTLVDQRTAHSRDVVKVVRSSLEGQVNVFATEVRLHVALKEAAKAGRSILEFDPHSPSADAYRSLAAEVLAVYGDQASPRPAPATPVAEDTDAGDNLLQFPVLAAAAADPAPEVVAMRPKRAEAPSFEAFVLEGSRRWLGASC
jgi:MinD-like ATPase involved in chromosome partitioning or flagellar assembly